MRCREGPVDAVLAAVTPKEGQVGATYIYPIGVAGRHSDSQSRNV